MNINDSILREIKTFKLKDTVKSAQKVFKNYPITHFPLVENGKLLGSFSQNDMQTIENKKKGLSNYTDLLYPFFADEKLSVLSLLSIFADNDANIIPVLNMHREYIGYYDLCDVLDAFSASPFLIEESETIIIEKTESDYSMSEVVQIVETNGAKLLGLYISERRNDVLQVTLKIVLEDLNEVIQTFRRYDYKVLSNFENDVYLEDLKNRSEYLQKYLEM